MLLYGKDSAVVRYSVTVHGLQLSVHGWKKTVNCEPTTVNGYQLHKNVWYQLNKWGQIQTRSRLHLLEAGFGHREVTPLSFAQPPL